MICIIRKVEVLGYMDTDMDLSPDSDDSDALSDPNHFVWRESEGFYELLAMVHFDEDSGTLRV
jgi:hypothetical protein